jgi:hypothetical protein
VLRALLVPTLSVRAPSKRRASNGLWGVVAVNQFSDAAREHGGEPEMELVVAGVQGRTCVEEGFKMLVTRRVRLAAEIEADVGKAVVDGDRHRRTRLGAFQEDRNSDGEQVRGMVDFLGGQVETDARWRSGISGGSG